MLLCVGIKSAEIVVFNEYSAFDRDEKRESENR